VEDTHTFYYIQIPGQPVIPGIAFLCLYRSGEPKSENHTEVKWVTEEELKGMPREEFIPGVKERYLEFFASHRRLAIGSQRPKQ
jgi:hypothetical protein